MIEVYPEKLPCVCITKTPFEGIYHNIKSLAALVGGFQIMFSAMFSFEQQEEEKIEC